MLQLIVVYWCCLGDLDVIGSCAGALYAGFPFSRLRQYLQTGRSRVQIPMKSLDFPIDLIVPAAIWP
jgi:hypothetical protein